MHQARFKKLIQRVNAKCLGRDAAIFQKDAMLLSTLHYKSQDHEKVTGRLFEINNDIKLFGKLTEKCPMRKVTWKIIPQNLKPQARLKYIKKGRKEL